MIWVQRLANVLLTLLAAIGLLGGALFVAVQTGHLKTFMFVSGSMQPTFGIGDAVLSKRVPAAGLEVGDVVTVPTKTGVPVTHRIVGIEEGDGSRLLTLRGDANERNDPHRYAVTEVHQPLLRLPGGGHAIVTLQRPEVALPAVFGAAGLVGLLMSLSRRDRTPAQARSQEGDRRPVEEPEGGAAPSPRNERAAASVV